jgi:hypothetical protein
MDAIVELCLSLSSENAVKTQTWCAIATYVRIAIIEKKLQPDAFLYTRLQILSVSIFEKTQISCSLQQTISNPTCTTTLTSSFCSISNRTRVGHDTYPLKIAAIGMPSIYLQEAGGWKSTTW